jgi:hypothetical protein
MGQKINCKVDASGIPVPKSIKRDNVQNPSGRNFGKALDSTWDRGHLVPNNDMPDDVSKKSAFKVVNRAPQLTKINRGVWKCAEASIRRLNHHVKNSLVVITYLEYGTTTPLDTVQETKGAKVTIPLAYHKVVYVTPNSRTKATISQFKSAVCISVSNRDPLAQPVIQGWENCPQELQFQLPKPTNPQDFAAQIALRNILFGEKDRLNKHDTINCSE